MKWTEKPLVNPRRRSEGIASFKMKKKERASEKADNNNTKGHQIDSLDLNFCY